MDNEKSHRQMALSPLAVNAIFQAGCLEKSLVETLFNHAYDEWVEKNKDGKENALADLPIISNFNIKLYTATKKSKTRLRLGGNVLFDYHFAIAEAEIRKDIKFTDVMLADPLNNTERLKENIIAEASDIFANFFEKLPCCISSISKYPNYTVEPFKRIIMLDTPKKEYEQYYDSLRKSGHDLFFFSDIIEKVNKSIQSDYVHNYLDDIKKVIIEKTKACDDNNNKALPAKYIESSIVLSQHDSFCPSLKLRVFLKYGNEKVYGEVIETGENLIKVFTQGANETYSAVCASCSNMLLSVVEKIKKAIAPRLIKLKDCPELIKAISLGEQIKVGSQISVRFTGFAKGKNYIEYLGNGVYAFARNPISEKPLACFSLSDYQQLNSLPFNSKKRATIPSDPIGFLRFANDVEELYASYQQNTNSSVPPILFQKSLTGKPNAVTICNKTYELKDVWEKSKGKNLTLYDRLQLLFTFAENVNKDYQQKYECIVPILNSLNPTDFSVLEYLNSCGRSWFSKIANDLEGEIYTTKTSVSTSLDTLCNTEVKEEHGKYYMLVRFNWTSSRHGDFKMYSPDYEIDPGFFNAAEPREFSLDELSSIIPAKRDDWFVNRIISKARETNDWWYAMNYLEHMPTTFIASFVKSKAGKDFLSHFEDSDATYIQFFLENIPGCKTLAKSLFKKEKK